MSQPYLQVSGAYLPGAWARRKPREKARIILNIDIECSPKRREPPVESFWAERPDERSVKL